MRIKKDRLVTLLLHAFMAFLAVLVLVPLVWILVTAFKSRQEVFSQVPTWLPRQIVWTNFKEVWNMVPFGAYYKNTFFISFGLLGVQLITVTLAAYAFGRLQFKGRDVLFILFLTQLMIAPQSLIIPNYLTISSLGFLDTRIAVAAPYIASAFGTFLVRQAFMSMPKELEEAAMMDGCKGLSFLYHIGVPLVKPSLLAFSLVSLTHHWNEFFWPMIVTETSKSRTLTIGLGIFAQTAEGGAEWTLLMAATLLAIGPLMLTFLLFQKHFINSFMMSGLKG
jgi:sn-glycerol 3-phosphate transport system permease protein